MFITLLHYPTSFRLSELPLEIPETAKEVVDHPEDMTMFLLHSRSQQQTWVGLQLSIMQPSQICVSFITIRLDITIILDVKLCELCGCRIFSWYQPHFPLDTKPCTYCLESATDMTSPSTKPFSIKQTNTISTIYKIVPVCAVLSSHDSKVCCRDPQ